MIDLLVMYLPPGSKDSKTRNSSDNRQCSPVSYQVGDTSKRRQRECPGIPQRRASNVSVTNTNKLGSNHEEWHPTSACQKDTSWIRIVVGTRGFCTFSRWCAHKCDIFTRHVVGRVTLVCSDLCASRLYHGFPIQQEHPFQKHKYKKDPLGMITLYLLVEIDTLCHIMGLLHIGLFYSVCDQLTYAHTNKQAT